MVSIHKRGGVWYASFRFGGSQFLPSLKTASEPEAEGIRGRIEETIRLLNTGRVSLPAAASRQEILEFVVSGAKLIQKPRLPKNADLEAVLDEYFETYAIGKENSTVDGERIHANHFKRLLGASTPFAQINIDGLQRYAAKRSKEVGLRGRKVSPETIRKEFRTFNQIWKMAVAKGYVGGPSPTNEVKLTATLFGIGSRLKGVAILSIRTNFSDEAGGGDSFRPQPCLSCRQVPYGRPPRRYPAPSWQPSAHRTPSRM